MNVSDERTVDWRRQLQMVGAVVSITNLRSTVSPKVRLQANIVAAC